MKMKKTKLNKYRVSFTLAIEDTVKARNEDEAKSELVARIADAIHFSNRIKEGFEWEILTMNANEFPSEDIK